LTGLASPESPRREAAETTFLWAEWDMIKVRERNDARGGKEGRREESVPVCEKHGNVHGRHDEDHMEPRIVVPRARSFVVAFVRSTILVLLVFLQHGRRKGSVDDEPMDQQRPDLAQRATGTTHPSATAAINA
jgi:hypothetical protein